MLFLLYDLVIEWWMAH